MNFLNIKNNLHKINKKGGGEKPTLTRGKNPPPPSTNGCHYMTLVLKNKI
tara:strand:- start:379 stop:528 length:150 start_codon:yes stop_codon:yes gene_type:complete